ncbi:2TM domain-containing protein, partial [Klebsiella pneumoniae subsp. pneumoniae]|uniref:2TM domain-containing protein n=1 Tax=Klebsiella pneumoniae TaxID=573 RepID=UPI003B27E5A3
AHRFRFLRCPHQESRFFRSLSVALVVCVLLAVLNRFTNPQYYWSGWVALIWGALLVVRGLRLFVFGEWIKNWRQARLQRLLRK